MTPRHHRRLRDILEGKGREVITVSPEGTVLEAMRVLVRHRIGAVLVVDDAGIRGILSERDVLRLGAEDPIRLAETRVEEAMTTTERLVTGSERDTVDHAMGVMTQRRVRHLPIVRQGALEGIVSIGDLVKSCLEEAEEENRHLKEYIQGRVR